MKPASCAGCPLCPSPYNFTEPTGPVDAAICIIGDFEEHRSTAKQISLLKRVGLAKDDVRLHNILSCQPPNPKAISQQIIHECQKNLQPVLREAHRVFIASGPVAAQNLLQFESHRQHKFILNNWHGCPTQVNGRWIVPTFSPKFLLEGNQKLTGVACFDLLQAKKIAAGTWQHQPAILRVDPSLEWFTKWVDGVLAAAEHIQLWIPVDVETIEKLTGKAEDALDSTEIQIVRINFASNPDEGITVPFIGGYIEQAKRICESTKINKFFWNWRYDVPLLREADIRVVYPFHDGMRMAKVLQSDVPLGLGFWAPFYSQYGSWKHLNEVNAAEYAAIDGFQELRVCHGLVRDLQKNQQWDTYMEDMYDFGRLVLYPAEEVGLLVNRAKLLDFKAELEEKETVLAAKIQSQVDESNCPLVGKWKKPPKNLAADQVLERQVELEIYSCSLCNAADVTPAHKCKKPKKLKLCLKEADGTICQQEKPCQLHARKKRAPKPKPATLAISFEGSSE